MNAKEIKELRSQLRNVVKELLTEELIATMEKRLRTQLKKDSDDLSKYVKSTLERIDKRSRDVQDIVVRQAFVKVDDSKKH